MLLIAIGYEEQYTCFVYASSLSVDMDNAKECVAYICTEQNLRKSDVDEVLVVSGDKVVHQYTSEHWNSF